MSNAVSMSLAIHSRTKGFSIVKMYLAQGL